MGNPGTDPLSVRTHELLAAAERGESDVVERLVPVVYDELRRIARAELRRLPPGQTLQTTALVHEAYLRLAGSSEVGNRNRAYFFAAAARAMRLVLVDRARRKLSQKRGGGRTREDAEVLVRLPVDDAPADLLDLDAALEKLEAEDTRKAEIVALRFFAGLEMGEIAEVLGVPLRTLEREWRFARAWLRSELDDDGGRST
ncbi:MAG: ECF-type sigma factor [Planctomycetota bacterium]